VLDLQSERSRAVFECLVASSHPVFTFSEHKHAAYLLDQLTDREYGLSEVDEAIRGAEAKEGRAR